MEQLAKKSRSYKVHEFSQDILYKVWNHGCGSVLFAHVLHDEGKILINSVFATAKDLKNLTDRFPNYELVKISLGYPDFYRYTLLSKYQNLKAL